MAIRTFKPTSPGIRQMSASTFEEVTKAIPEKRLLRPANKTGGRNNYGRVTVRFRRETIYPGPSGFAHRG